MCFPQGWISQPLVYVAQIKWYSSLQFPLCGSFRTNQTTQNPFRKTRIDLINLYSSGQTINSVSLNSNGIDLATNETLLVFCCKIFFFSFLFCKNFLFFSLFFLTMNSLAMKNEFKLKPQITTTRWTRYERLELGFWCYLPLIELKLTILK